MPLGNGLKPTSTVDMVNKFLSANLNNVQEASDSDEETKELIKLPQREDCSECQFDITSDDDSEPRPSKNEDIMNLTE